jgi:hypothetical protein
VIDTEAYRTTLDRLERDLEQWETHGANLRAAIAAIRGLIEATTTTFTATGSKTSAPPPPRAERDPRLATATMEAAAMIVLEKTGIPMRVREIFDTAVAMGYRYPKGFEKFKGSMTPTLDRRPQFEKVGKGLYTLRALGHTNGSAVPRMIGTVLHGLVD